MPNYTKLTIEELLGSILRVRNNLSF